MYDQERKRIMKKKVEIIIVMIVAFIIVGVIEKSLLEKRLAGNGHEMGDKYSEQNAEDISANDDLNTRSVQDEDVNRTGGSGWDVSGEFTKNDIVVTPAKKTIRVGQTFFIYVVTADESEWDDYSDEEWEEICENNIDSITYRSSMSSVASVNKKTGEVIGKKKGSAVIKTSINLANGESAIYKTKVYVTRR